MASIDDKRGRPAEKPAEEADDPEFTRNDRTERTSYTLDFLSVCMFVCTSVRICVCLVCVCVCVHSVCLVCA